MRRLSPIPALLSIVLLGAAGQAMAAESRQSTADVGDSCPDSAAAANDRIDEAEADPNAPATPVKRTAKAKATAAPRSTGGNRSTAPRWHSFLPGMFR